ncbi:hypothetical protein [Helicobacter heilmannii]|uniref:hypothetical protein n=1 Tax=Helicobacter heilmannii TaxID=35817 RepID=UPI0022391D78|nr:hypothetical protein [Helicobacter heilmannii]
MASLSLSISLKLARLHPFKAFAWIKWAVGAWVLACFKAIKSLSTPTTFLNPLEKETPPPHKRYLGGNIL